MTVYGYIRVSTDKQTTENQRFEIGRFLENHSIMSLIYLIYIFLKKSPELYNYSSREA